MSKAIALTGGIGSGKSTVAKIFASMAVPVLDLDAVGRSVLDKPKVQSALMASFGSDIDNGKGDIDRGLLAARAFSDKKKTKQLNAILHPEIVSFEQQWLKNQHAPYVIIEASVLLESGGISRMDGLIVVLADIELRQQRVLERGKQDEDMFRAIVQRQCDDDMRCKYADYILCNNGSLEALEQQVRKLSKQLIKEYV